MGLPPKIRRAISVAAVWSLALASLGLAFGAYVQHREAKAELDKLASLYDSQMQDYGRLLAEGEQLRGDKDYQIKLLKKRFGYTEADETPIVIVKQYEGQQVPANKAAMDTAPPPAKQDNKQSSDE
jgi:hypothetical protein